MADNQTVHMQKVISASFKQIMRFDPKWPGEQYVYRQGGSEIMYDHSRPGFLIFMKPVGDRTKEVPIPMSNVMHFELED